MKTPILQTDHISNEQLKVINIVIHLFYIINLYRPASIVHIYFRINLFPSKINLLDEYFNKPGC